jgi:DNA recombination-dependent growth factor C
MTVFRVAPDRSEEFTGNIIDTLRDLDNDSVPVGLLASDPEGGNWGTHGLVTPTPMGDYFHDLDGAGMMMAVQFNERILPGKVIQERVDQMVQGVFERDGRHPGKKERAILREEAELELLPTAFIRRTTVHLMITSDNRLFVFTASTSRSDRIVSFLYDLFSNMSHPLVITHLTPSCDVVNKLTGIALASESTCGTLVAAMPMIMKDDESNRVTVRDTNVSRESYLDLIKQGYRVQELGLRLHSEQHESVGFFRLTHSFLFKGITLDDEVVLGHSPDDLHATAWMICREYSTIVNSVMSVFVEDESGEL